MSPTTSDRSTRPVGWLAGLDGLRALAVGAVMVFHFAPDLLPGGFLGVDLFFAISGYLITRLLLLQMYRSGRLDLLGFYRRRWRRLFPAVAALLGVVTVASLLVWRDELATLREGVLASAGFVTNWWLIFDHQSYFVAVGRPPMVQHLWSLAIEEQFYLIWPLVLAVLVGVIGLRRRPRVGAAVTRAALVRVAVACTVLGTGSAVLMDWLAVRDDVPYGTDSARIYFGTDTHASGLLFGAAFGALSLWRVIESSEPFRPRRVRSERATRLIRSAGRWLTDTGAILALGLLAWQTHHLTEFDPMLYRGGFAVVSLLAAVLVAAVARPLSRVGRLLDFAVLRWLGQRSYAMYLWHWPVAVVTRPGIDITGPRWLLMGNQIAITMVLAAASYRFIEQPFRTGAAARWWAGHARVPRRPGRADGFSPWRRLAAWGLAAACLVSAVTAGETSRHPAVAETAPTAGALVGVSSSIDTIGTLPSSSAASAVMASPTPLTGTPAGSGRRATPGTAGTSPKAVGPAVVPLTAQPISGFGDSVMLGAAPALVAALPKMGISAIEGRQARSVFADVESRRAAGTLASIVVIHTGDNGIISPDDLRATLRSLAPRRLVVLLTARVPREWQGPNDSTIKKVGAAFTNVRVVDWYAASNGHPSWFYSDGLHLRPVGATAYAALIRAALLSFAAAGH